MLQSLDIVLLDVVPLEIHSSRFYDLRFRPVDAPEGAPSQSLRINPEAFYENPQRGDRVRVDVAMGNILSARKLDEGET